MSFSRQFAAIKCKCHKTPEHSDTDYRRITMNLQKHKNRFYTALAALGLFIGSALFVSAHSNESEMIAFSDLTDADISVILAVKAEMEAARLQTEKN